MRATSRTLRPARRAKERIRLAHLEERPSAALPEALDEVEAFGSLVGRPGFDVDAYIAKLEARP